MGRGDLRRGGGESPNSASWKERAEELEEQLIDAEAEKEELESRLAEIASIAAPDLTERVERIDETLAELLKLVKLLAAEKQEPAPDNAFSEVQG